MQQTAAPAQYTAHMPEPLTTEEVRHIASLARLRLTDEQVEAYRGELTSILRYVARLRSLDVEEVEPMAHPLDLTNRLGADEVGPSMTLNELKANAPAVQDRFLAVPKVIGDGGNA